MFARPFFLSLCLFAALWAGGGAPAGADPLSLSGEVRLALSSETPSFLPIDIGALAERLCPNPDREEGMAKCHLTVLGPSGPPGGGSTALKGAVGVSPPNLMANLLNLQSAEGVDTSCGIWDFTLTLDPDLPQPESPMAFEEDAEDPGHGVFAGVMEMITILHLTNRETGQAVDFPLRLGLGMAGPWVSVPPEISSDPLLLFGGIQGGIPFPEDTCIPVWMMQYPEEVENLVAQGCQICWYPDLQQREEAADGSME